ncbi:MAG: pilus assembly protein PilM [Cystobacterineae bacterium]|nr:pilus assembly protein PilM [Cystobacterineae bacterium]
MAKILAIDVGAYSLKLAMMESMRKATPSVRFEEFLNQGTPLDTLSAALGRIFGSKISGVDQVFFSLPGTSIATHQLPLPFADHKRIEATLGFEIENISAMDMAALAFDYQPIANPSQDNRLLVGMALRQELVPWIQQLSGLSVEPRWIAHPALQLGFLASASARRKHQPLPKNFAVADIGHERCCFFAVNASNSCDIARVFPSGGKEITAALSSAFGISEQEAAAWKEKHGTLLPSNEHPPAAHKAAEVMQQALLSMERELRILLKMREAQGQEPIETLFLVGGGSQLHGLDSYLSKSLALPVELLPLTGFRENLPPSAGQVASLLSFYSLTAPRTRRFNFRQKELAYKSELDFLKDKLKPLSIFALCAVVLFLAGGFVRNSFLKTDEQHIDDALCALTTRVLGTCERDYVRAESLLLSSSNPAPELFHPSAADFLSHLVQYLPPQFDIQFEQILIQPERISLRSKASQKLDIDALSAALKTIPCVGEINAGKVEKSRDGLKKNFPLDIKLACPPPLEPDNGHP